MLYVARGRCGRQGEICIGGRGLLPKDTSFVVILDPLSDEEQLRRRQQDNPYPVTSREGTAGEDDDVVRDSGMKACDILSELLQTTLNWYS